MIPASLLVPGDLILLRTGDHVPADARLLELRSSSFSTDESFLTGENTPVLKRIEEMKVEDIDGVSSLANIVFSGSTVTSGSALAVVTHIGKETEIGKINSDVQQSKTEKLRTPLTQSLDRFTLQLTNLVGAICLGLWVSNIPKFNAFGSWSRGALHYAKNAVALGVAAVPEGLPAAVTLCLSLGTRKMAKKNIIIRKLSSLETLGCTSVICTDKTGTLTTNQMTVTSLVTFAPQNDNGNVMSQERTVEGNSYAPVGLIKDSNGIISSSALAEDLSRICALCNNAEIAYDPKEGYSRIGEPTEAALKVLVEKIGKSQSSTNTPLSSSSLPSSVNSNSHSQRIKSGYRLLSELEFNRERKIMSSLYQTKTDVDTVPLGNRSLSSPLLLVSKGAPEMILSRCSQLKLEDGTVIPITDQIRSQLFHQIQELSQRPLRVIGLAYKDSTDLKTTLMDLKIEDLSRPFSFSAQYESLESNLVFTGLCGITDPLRDGIKASLKKCQEAGIRVLMMTGDSRETALSIGYQAGIFNTSSSPSSSSSSSSSSEYGEDNQGIISGKEFNQLSTSQQVAFLKNLSPQRNKIFYRMESQDKKLLIRLLQEHCQEVVAMTGDGINDASALASADIGIAMGIAGTEVTKESSDMILTDDSFAGIVSAIEEGRSLYSNLQSMISYLISCNLGEVGIILLVSLLGLPEILLPLHLLYINLITDGPPATALGFNPSDLQVMKTSPRKRDVPLLTGEMMRRFLISSTYETAATVGAFVWWFLDKGVTWSQLLNWRKCSLPSSLSAVPSLSQCSPLLSSPFFSLSAPQSMALSVLLLIESLKALSSISSDRSLLSVPPWRNKWLLLMIGFSLSLHLTVMYSPLLGSLLSIAPLSLREWKVCLFPSHPSSFSSLSCDSIDL
jgi:P-type Ca2+ transporter type 2C